MPKNVIRSAPGRKPAHTSKDSKLKQPKKVEFDSKDWSILCTAGQNCGRKLHSHSLPSEKKKPQDGAARRIAEKIIMVRACKLVPCPNGVECYKVLIVDHFHGSTGTSKRGDQLADGIQESEEMDAGIADAYNEFDNIPYMDDDMMNFIHADMRWMVPDNEESFAPPIGEEVVGFADPMDISSTEDADSAHTPDVDDESNESDDEDSDSDSDESDTVSHTSEASTEVSSDTDSVISAESDPASHVSEIPTEASSDAGSVISDDPSVDSDDDRPPRPRYAPFVGDELPPEIFPPAALAPLLTPVTIYVSKTGVEAMRTFWESVHHYLRSEHKSWFYNYEDRLTYGTEGDALILNHNKIGRRGKAATVAYLLSFGTFNKEQFHRATDTTTSQWQNEYTAYYHADIYMDLAEHLFSNQSSLVTTQDNNFVPWAVDKMFSMVKSFRGGFYCSLIHNTFVADTINYSLNECYKVAHRVRMAPSKGKGQLSTLGHTLSLLAAGGAK